jgi:hypothetical protein
MLSRRWPGSAVVCVLVEEGERRSLLEGRVGGGFVTFSVARETAGSRALLGFLGDRRRGDDVLRGFSRFCIEPMSAPF